MRYPRFAIVGRPNVGKSSLLNALARQQVAIVERTAGVTRDRVAAVVDYQELAMEVIDTAGLDMETEKALEREVARQIEEAIDLADAFLLVMDARDGLTPADRQAAELVRRTAKPVIVVANKVDTLQQELALGEFYKLGFGEPVATAAIHGHGRKDLFERMIALLGPDVFVREEQKEGATRVAFVGRRNAGKSTLVNRLTKQARMVVSDVPGTTRDAVDVPFELEGRPFIAVDTAGLRKRGKADDAIDMFSQDRAQRAIRRAHVVVLVMDALTEVARIDKLIGQQTVDHYKPCVVAVNKWDLADESKRRDFATYVLKTLPGLANAPTVFISAETGQGVDELMEQVAVLHNEAASRVTTGELNRIIREATSQRRPKPRGGRVGKIYYATQTDTLPPTIVLFVNGTRQFDAIYLRYLANRLRQSTPFVHVPVRFELRERSKADGRANAR